MPSKAEALNAAFAQWVEERTREDPPVSLQAGIEAYLDQEASMSTAGEKETTPDLNADGAMPEAVDDDEGDDDEGDGEGAGSDDEDEETGSATKGRDPNAPFTRHNDFYFGKSLEEPPATVEQNPFATAAAVDPAEEYRRMAAAAQADLDEQARRNEANKERDAKWAAAAEAAMARKEAMLAKRAAAAAAEAGAGEDEDDAAGDGGDAGDGQMRKASAEVLKTRRRVKVRRDWNKGATLGAGGAGTPAAQEEAPAAANPFAGISFTGAGAAQPAAKGFDFGAGASTPAAPLFSFAPAPDADK